MGRRRGLRRWSGWLAVGAVLFWLAGPASAQWDKLLKGQGSAGAGLSDAKIGAGLKEALQVATGKTVTRARAQHEQEKDIRTNPSARATDLLKEVFKR